MIQQRPATLDDLYDTEGQAELIDGRIVHQMATGHRPNEVAGNIYVSLREHAKRTGAGHAYTDSMGFAVLKLPSGRQSFSPDASFYIGPLPMNLMRFIDGPPTFAIEVRSENDYGPAPDAQYAEKRTDYFVAGTAVVWDVDPLAGTITSYLASDPARPHVFRAGDSADAEPAIPGWRITVADVFA